MRRGKGAKTCSRPQAGHTLDWNPDPGSHTLTFALLEDLTPLKGSVSLSMPQGCRVVVLSDSGSLGHGSFLTRYWGARTVGEGMRGFL